MERIAKRVGFLTWPRAFFISWGTLVVTTWAASYLIVPGSWPSVVVDGFLAWASALCLWGMGPQRRPCRRTPVAWAVALFACMWVFGQACSAWFLVHVDDAAFASYTSNMSSFGIWGYLLLTVGLAPLSEELLFRGVTLRAFAAGVGPRAALVLQAVVFALSHGTLTHLFPTFLAGLFFGWLALRTGRIRWSVIAHSANNAVSLLLAPYVQGMSSWLPIAVWIVLAALLAVLLVAGLWLSPTSKAVGRHAAVRGES